MCVVFVISFFAKFIFVNLKDGTDVEYWITDVDSISFTKRLPVKESPYQIAGHNFVDLGLPSGTLWASCNVGADNSKEKGYSFYWGDVNYEYVKDMESPWVGAYRTELQMEGVIDDSLNLTPEFDAATVLWGSLWKTPSSKELDELLENCTWHYNVNASVKGHTLKSKINGNSIFIPDVNSICTNCYSYFWTSSNIGDDDRTYCLMINYGFKTVKVSNDRTSRCYIRPVSILKSSDLESNPF